MPIEQLAAFLVGEEEALGARVYVQDHGYGGQEAEDDDEDVQDHQDDQTTRQLHHGHLYRDVLGPALVFTVHRLEVNRLSF